ncbi:MAG: amino acid ABC transporter substrate-binding protein, partial [Candidatus Competibacteraceae bacterium]|nr:amino acid ABC transporter substrate-binding protein [Candidatus Competibacteraceae bacterium]
MKRLLMLASALLLACQAWGGATLEAVKRRGYVQCGISDGLPGFSQPDKGGSYRGLDVDFCRAVAAALFGDAAQVRYIPLTSRERFTALQSGEVDLLSRNTTWTSSRDSAMGLHFAGIIYYDGQGFMVPRDKSLEQIEQLDGARICLQPGTTTALNLADYFTSHNLKFTPVFHERSEASALAFQRGECDALTSDQSQLYAQRLRLDRPDHYRVLPTIISKEPLGPVVRHGDDEWFD